MGPGFKSLPVQHDHFVGPGFDSLALSAHFWARYILGLRHSPPRMEQQVAPQKKKLLSEVKKTCLHEWWPLLYGEVEGYLLVTKA